MLKNIINSLVSFVKIIIKYKNVIVPISFGNNKKLLIVGNGPSANSVNLFKFDSTLYCMMAVNYFAKSEIYESIKPENYVLLDPNFFLYINSKDQDEIFNILESKTNWKLNLFIPAQNKLPLLKNPNINIHRFNYIVYNGFETLGYYLFSKNLAMPQCQNVLVAALYLGINMGFKEINIIGAENSWHKTLIVNDQNRLCTVHNHFYSVKEEPILVPFYKTKDQKEVFTMAEIFATFAKIFRGYEAIRKYADYKEAKIYNLTPDSFIDAFERKTI